MAAIRGQVYLYGRTLELMETYPALYQWAGVSEVIPTLHGSAYSPHTSHQYDSDLTADVTPPGPQKVDEAGLSSEMEKRLQGREVRYDTATKRFQFFAARVTWPRSTILARWMVLHFGDVRDFPTLCAWVDFGREVRTTDALFEVAWSSGMVFEVSHGEAELEGPD